MINLYYYFFIFNLFFEILKHRLYLLAVNRSNLIDSPIKVI